MRTAAATVSDRAAQPELTRAGTRAPATPNAVAVLIAVVFNLIAHGRDFALAVRGQIRASGGGVAGWFFGTGTIRVIGRCVRRGVMRSVALYKMLWHRATTGLGLRLPGPRRERALPGQHAANAPANPAAHGSAHNTAPGPTWPHTCELSDLAMQDEAADEARRRAAGAIPANIRRGLGMFPDNAGALSDERLAPIRRFGGSLTQVLAEVDRCKAPASRVETPRFERAPEHQRPNCLSAEEQLRDVPPPQAESAACSLLEVAPRTASGKAFERTATAPAMHWPVVPPKAREVAAAPLS